MIKKALSISMTLSMLLLAACGSNSTTSSSPSNNAVGGTSESKSEAPKSGEKVTISWWDYQRDASASAEALEMIINEYEKAHPNVDIVRTYVPFADLKNKLLMGTAAGQLPDIVMIDNPDHQAFSAAGIFADITKEVQEWGQGNQYYEGPWSSTMYNGKNFGIPGKSNNLALYYNADMLKKAGVEPPKTWNELKEAAKKLTKPGVYGFGASAIKTENGMFQFLPFVWSAGSDLNNFNSQGTIDAITLWKDLIDQGHMSKEVLTQDQQAIMLQFVNGNTAMAVNGTWQIPLAKKEAKFNWGVVELPSNVKGGSILGGENFAITASSKQKDVAWDIIKFSQEPEMLKKYLVYMASTPTRKDLTDPFWTEDPIMKVFADTMKVAKARAYGPNYPKISEHVQTMMHEVITGTKSAEDAVKETDEKIKPLLP